MNRSIIVVLREWCPDCLEYKLSLNKLLSENDLDISFAFPEEVSDIFKIDAIPTTLFIEDGRVIQSKLDTVEHRILIEFLCPGDEY